MRRALFLEYLTVGYNSLEAIVAIAAGLAAGSVALIGFGLDSIIETVSAGILIWRLKRPAEEAEAAERKAVRVVGVTLLALAAYILYEAVRKLYLREAPHESPVGIGLAVLSLATMLWLARAKRRAGARIGSRALVADSSETYVCALLSVALLLGLGLNALWGWWWADPVAALAMLPFVVKEGLEAFEGEEEDEEVDD
jgi:divalent metal cation (Fe/Co/Zn/Cd) transporter